MSSSSLLSKNLMTLSLSDKSTKSIVVSPPDQSVLRALHEAKHLHVRVRVHV